MQLKKSQIKFKDQALNLPKKLSNCKSRNPTTRYSRKKFATILSLSIARAATKVLLTKVTSPSNLLAMNKLLEEKSDAKQWGVPTKSKTRKLRAKQSLTLVV